MSNTAGRARRCKSITTGKKTIFLNSRLDAGLGVQSASRLHILPHDPVKPLRSHPLPNPAPDLSSTPSPHACSFALAILTLPFTDFPPRRTPAPSHALPPPPLSLSLSLASLRRRTRVSTVPKLTRTFGSRVVRTIPTRAASVERAAERSRRSTETTHARNAATRRWCEARAGAA